MGNNLTEKGAKAANLRAQKRAEALRDNLKRRKLADAGNRPDDKPKGEERDAKSENRQ
jgi:hypothetical protein